MTVGISELPPEGMQLGGVALAGDADRGTRTTEGLNLLFTTAGITVQGPQPQIERLLVWSGLDTATCGEKVVLPDGRDAAVMELTSGGQSIRFLLPTDAVTPGQAAYLDQALPAWLARYKGSVASTPGPPRPAAEPGPQATGGVGATPTGQPAPPSADRGVAAPGVAAAGAAAAGAAAGSPVGANGAPVNPRPTMAGPGPGAPSGSPPPAPPTPASPTPSATPPSRAPTPGIDTTHHIDTTHNLDSADGPDDLEPSDTASAFLPHPARPGRGHRPTPPPPPMPGTAGFVPAPPDSPPGASGGTGGPGVTPTAPGQATPLSGPTAPAPGQPGPDTVVPTKKTRAWRKASPPAGTGPVPPPGGQVPQPPARPPANPVPLTSTTLPPPPPDGLGGAGAPGWASTGAGTGGPGGPVPPTAPTARGRRGRKAARAEAAAAAGVLAATGVNEAAPMGATPTAPAAPPGAPTAPGGLSVPPPGRPPYAGLAPGAPARPGAPPGPAPTPPQGTVPPPPPPATAAPAARSKNNRTVVVVLLVVLVVVIAAIVVLAVRRNGSTTATTQPSVTSPSAVAADTALAVSINLRLADLPAGWTQVSSAGQVVRPPVAPAAAQVQANRALAACVGVDYPTAAGLFGGSVLPGQTNAVRSPTYASGSDPNVQMYSMTTIMSSHARTQALVAPFTNPNFANCYGQYQSALASSAVPGATAQVQVVTLSAPTGVQAFGYLTTLNIPNQGSEIIGQAFMLGGRIETRLQPTTNGPAVPSDAFNPAYNAVAGRISRALNN